MKIVEDIDLFAASPTLRSKQKSKSGSIILLFLSFGFICAIIILFAQMLRFTINMNEGAIKYSSYYEINETAITLNNFMFGIIFEDVKTDQQMKKKEQIFELVVQYWNEQRQIVQRNILQICQPQSWAILGLEYKQIFKDQKFQYSFCPKFPLSISPKNFQKNSFNIYIQNCNSKNATKKCKIIQEVYNSTGYIPIKIKYLSKIANLRSKDSINLYFQQVKAVIKIEKNVNNQIYIPQKSVISQYIDKFRIEDDSTLVKWLMPESFSYNIKITQNYTIGDLYFNIRRRSIIGNDKYLEVSFLINQKIQVYERSRSLIQQIMSDIGGIFEICIAIGFFFFISYNKINYQLSVAGSYFNYNDDGYKFRSKDLNPYYFFLYSIHKWIKFLCHFSIAKTDHFRGKNDTNAINMMQQTMQQGCKILDIKNFYRKLDYLEKIAEEGFDQRQFKLLSLRRRRNFNQIKFERVLMSYYSKIIQQNPAATVQDAINNSSQSFRYLFTKEFYKKYKIPKDFIQKNQNIENQMNQIKLSLQNNLKLHPQISQCISRYILIAKQADCIIINSQYRDLQARLTQKFVSLSDDERHEVIKKIPILIIHRLRKKAQESLQERASQISRTRKKNNQNDYIIKKNEKTWMQFVLDFLKQFDFYPIQPLLRTSNKDKKSMSWFGFKNQYKDHKSSPVLGVISFFIIILIFTIFIIEIQKIRNFHPSTLVINTYQEVDDAQLKQIKNFMVAIKFPKSQNYFKDQLSLFTQFRFQLLQKNTNVEYNQIPNSLGPCRAESWRLLGPDFYDYYVRQKLNEAYCMSVPINITINSGKDFFKLKFKNCTNLGLDSCSKQFYSYYNEVLKQYNNFPFWLYYLTPQIQTNRSDPIVHHTKISRFAVPKGKSGSFIQYYKAQQIFELSVTKLGTFADNGRKQYIPTTTDLYQYNSAQQQNEVIFYLQNNVKKYNRIRRDYLTVVANIGGLLSFLSLFTGYMFKKYNQICYQLNVGESSFNCGSRGKKIRQNDFYLHSYVNFRFQVLLLFLFPCLKKKCCKKVIGIRKNLNMINELMNIQYVLLRIQILQQMIKKNISEELYVCMTLQENLSISEIRKKRKIMNYYDFIIRQKKATNLIYSQDEKNKIKDSFQKALHIEPYKRPLNFFNIRRIADESTEIFDEIQNRTKQPDIDQIKLTLVKYLHIGKFQSQRISQYTGFDKQAKEIEINYEQNQIETEITLAFIALDPKKKEQLVNKIPFKIIHRLRMKAIQLSNLSQKYDKSLKTNQQKVYSIVNEM